MTATANTYLTVAGSSSLATGVAAAKGPKVNWGRHQKALQALEAHAFWAGKRPVRALWPHQQAAISHSIAYLCADARIADESDVLEAALLKLPTGTGKSGIIAILSRCLPAIRSVLLLTPREALTEQLLGDVESRFWGNIGFPADSLEPAIIRRLLPHKVSELFEEHRASKERVVWVSTHQTLDIIRRRASGETEPEETAAQAAEGEASDSEAASGRRAIADARTVLEALQKFDLLIVDEGHYEPAPSWSRGVRQLNRPTVLLSATPFRNDYKSFRVRGRFVYNLSLPEATKKKIIRDVQFPGVKENFEVEAGAEPQAGSDRATDTQEPRELTETDTATLETFVSHLHEQMPAILEAAREWTPTPKCILRAASFEALELLQSTLKAQVAEPVLMIHDRVSRDDSTNLKFHNVRAALKHGTGVRYWLHQSKLLEGIDDPSIVAVGILNGFSNTRQLVQQIGRAIRSTDPNRRARQAAKVIALPELRDEMYARWQRYRKYEDMAAKSIEAVVQSEGALPERLLGLMPEFQYVAGDFREKYLLKGHVTAEDLKLSLRTSIFCVKPHFDRELAEEELVEALIADDRFVPRLIEGLPDAMFGRTYYGWGSSPYLARQYLTEWTLGVVVAAHIGRFLFVQDTGGICFDPNSLRIRRAEREELLKAFPDTSDASTKLTRVSGNLLDMSDRSIRSQAYRARSVEDTFTDLSDPAFILSSAYGYVGGSGRYLGLKRARWSDASDAMVSIGDFRRWLQQVHDRLESGTPRHKVFDRYAQVASVDPDEAKPISILLDLASESFEEFRVLGEGDEGESGHDIPYEDLCQDVNPENGEFILKMLDGEDIPCTLAYMPSSQRYRLESPKLDEKIPLRSRAGKPQTLTELINREQNFRILTSKPQVVYSGGSFYKTRDLTVNGTVFALEDAHVVPELARAYTEKGEHLYEDHRAEWHGNSIFGYVHARCQPNAPRQQNEFAKRIRTVDTVLLDDGPKEICDFIALERERRRVILVHAKASLDAHWDAVTALQIVGRQVLGSLAFCSTLARVAALDPNRWRQPVIANTVTLHGLSRIFESPIGEPFADTARVVLSALANPSWNREIWIVAGRLLDLPYVKGLALTAMPPSRCRQLIMYLSSLQTACQRAGARLLIFAHHDAPKPADIPVRE